MHLVKVTDDGVSRAYNNVIKELVNSGKIEEGERDIAPQFKEATGYYLAIENGGLAATIIFENENEASLFALKW